MILAGHDKEVAEWVATKLPHFHIAPDHYRALGLLAPGGQLVAGVVYDNFRGHDLHMHIAAVEGRRWLRREFLYEGFRYPFEQLGCERLTGLVASRNIEAQRFDEKLGFVLEGRLRQWLPDGDDLLVYGMLKSECRFLKRHGVH